jgi:hypothetical protein
MVMSMMASMMLPFYSVSRLRHALGSNLKQPWCHKVVVATDRMTTIQAIDLQRKKKENNRGFRRS